MKLSVRFQRIVAGGLLFLAGSVHLVAQGSTPMTQPPTQYNHIYNALGFNVGDDEAGWEVINDEGLGFKFVELKKGAYTVWIHEGGEFLLCANQSREEQAMTTAKIGDSVVVIESEQQAISRAQTLLQDLGLWSSNYVNGHCQLGVTERLDSNTGMSDGQASVGFDFVHSGLPVYDGPARVRMNRFTGQAMKIQISRPFTFPSSTPNVSVTQARANALAFAATLPSNHEDHYARLEALQTAELVLGYGLDENSTTTPLPVKLEYGVLASKTVFIVDAMTGVARQDGGTRGIAPPPSPPLGSTSMGPEANPKLPGTGQESSFSSTILLAVASILAAVACGFLLLRRAKPRLP